MIEIKDLGESSVLTNATKLRELCLDALSVCERAVQKCLAAGLALNETKAQLTHGDFMYEVSRLIPEVSHKTVNNWMRAANNIIRVIPPMDESVGLSASLVLSTPDENLPESAREWKHIWTEFTADKTIRECLNGVLLGEDESHRVDRALNGKFLGGAGGNRKDFPIFIAVKFKDAGTHFSHWNYFNFREKTEIISILLAAINGNDIEIRKRNIQFSAWPKEVCVAIHRALEERLKGAK